VRHLGKDQLLDLAEGIRLEASVAHVESCEACRRQVDDLRAAMAAVADVEVPEPSPLFWEHLSERVRAAVAAEGQLAPSRAWHWTDWRIMAPLGGLTALLVAAAITLNPGAPPGSGSDQNFGAAIGTASPIAADLAPLTDDPSLSLLADLTSDLDWDAATEAGLSLKAGVLDDLVTALNDEERQELQRLLREELAQPGV
jgi:hypothetical protein